MWTCSRTPGSASPFHSISFTRRCFSEIVVLQLELPLYRSAARHSSQGTCLSPSHPSLRTKTHAAAGAVTPWDIYNETALAVALAAPLVVVQQP